MLILNEEQKSAVCNMVDFYKDPHQMVYVLDGPAGTGKTTTIQNAIQEIQKTSARPLNICMTAPTNKATKVLLQMAFDRGLNVICKTTYALLGLVLDSNNEIRYAAKMLDGSMSDFDLVIVDEASFCGERLWGILIDQAYGSGTKVIAMGDKAQLRPVKEKAANIFNNPDYSKTSLTKVMRQTDGNPVLDLCNMIRDAQVDPRIEPYYESNVNEATEQGVWVMGAASWMEYIKENFNSDEYHNDPDSFRCVAYTNRRVDYLNKVIRNVLVGQTEEPFIVGERVLAKKPIKADDGMTAIHTDEESEVKMVSLGTFTPEYEEPLKTWDLELMSDSGHIATAQLIHKDSKKDFNDLCSHYAELAKADGKRWREFWALKDTMAELQCPHAVTAHRSQGSTFKNVFVDMKDLHKNRNRSQRLELEYVACSRASENLIIML